MTISGCRQKEHVIVIDASMEAVILDDHHRVYYQIFVGSFSDASGDGVGDLRGIINRLDYLNDGQPDSGKSLGVQGLWLSPIMRSTSYHKYDVIDYETIDSDFGTFDDFKELVDKASERGIDIIIDLVVNHTSIYHHWFRTAKKAVEDGDMNHPYIDYYTLVTDEQREGGKTYYYFAGDFYYEANFSSTMPELNFDNEAVRAEFVDIMAFWFDLGVAGFRLDAIKYIYLHEESRNLAFWQWFAEAARALKPDVYLVGEAWSGDALIAPYYQNFSNFDFGMSQVGGAIAMTANGNDDVNNYVTYLNLYRNLVERYQPQAVLTPFIANHDMNRAAGYLSVDGHRMQMAANLYLLTYGTPFIYYGEEIGMKGSRGTENTDANRRLAMLWGDKDSVQNPVGSTYASSLQTNGTVQKQLTQADSLLNHYKRVIILRNANPEIGRGAYTPIIFEGQRYFGGFLSTYQSNTIGVFHNTSEWPITIDLSLYTDHSFAGIRGYVGRGEATLSNQTLTLDGLTSVVIK